MSVGRVSLIALETVCDLALILCDGLLTLANLFKYNKAIIVYLFQEIRINQSDLKKSFEYYSHFCEQIYIIFINYKRKYCFMAS